MTASADTAPEWEGLWNGVSGNAWVDSQELLDNLLRPIEELLAQAAAAAGARAVLDIGCGTGATTLATARRLAAAGRCVGIDISEPMIACARGRARLEGIQADFIRDDAQTHAFAPGSFDRVISRFGVMFFDDPVAAFHNLRHAVRDEAELHLVVWRGPAENPFMTTAERAAAPLLPNLPVRRPGAPGQFGFSDRDLVHRVLQDSGWTGIAIAPLDFACSMSETELTRYFTQFGPVGQLLGQAEAGLRARVIETVRPAFDPFVVGAEVRFTAACWVVSARALSGLS